MMVKMLPENNVHNNEVFENNHHNQNSLNFKREIKKGEKIIRYSSQRKPLEPILDTKSVDVSAVCRHFKKGFCMYWYSECKYFVLCEVVCRFFQTSRCKRNNCWYLHLGKQEEMDMIQKLKSKVRIKSCRWSFLLSRHMKTN